ncbi:potassium channel family protein [Roseovarius aquimarinus]|uniref:Potassium channel family protein n=1 Tax=Roseovarius aquimarinus TaxID=1229156 RepID=A0ABW7I4Z3_9RHOB
MRFLLEHLLGGITEAFKDARVRGLLALTFSLILIASCFYWYVEGWSLLDAVYFSVITIATVGYGDFSPQTVAGKVFTMFYVLCGLGIFVAAASAIAESILKDRKDRH